MVANIPLFISIAFSGLLLCSKGLSAAQQPGISLGSLRAHMDSVASDATEGRFTGTPGFTIAARYAEQQFREAGLLVKEQPVPFSRDEYDTLTSLTVWKNGKAAPFKHSDADFLVLHPGTMPPHTPANPPVFIGYGISEPGAGWDDYKGLDLKGKWVILLQDFPAEGPASLAFPASLKKRYADWDTCEALKYQALLRHQVAGVIVLPDKSQRDHWERTAMRKYRFNYMHSAESVTKDAPSSDFHIPCLLVHPKIAAALFDEQIYDPASDSGQYHSFTLEQTLLDVTIAHQRALIYSPNILARLAGTDTALTHQYITVSGHLDHLGKFGSHIYNGANDDASACAIILAVAKTLARRPLKRPVLFILFTGEELGMAGSAYFTQYPALPLDDILVNINIEQIGSNSRTFPGIWGIGVPQFQKDFLNAGAAATKEELKYDGIKEMEEAIKDCDTWNFYDKHIPSILLSSGGFTEYHQPEDKIDRIDFPHLQHAANLLESLITIIGNK